MHLARKNSRLEIKQETAINSGQMKSLFSDLLVWGSKHSTERRQDEPSRPPTAYSLRKTEDGVIPYGHTHTHTHSWPPEEHFQFSDTETDGKRVCVLFREQSEVSKIILQTLLGHRNSKSLSVCVCVCTNIHGGCGVGRAKKGVHQNQSGK